MQPRRAALRGLYPTMAARKRVPTRRPPATGASRADSMQARRLLCARSLPTARAVRGGNLRWQGDGSLSGPLPTETSATEQGLFRRDRPGPRRRGRAPPSSLRRLLAWLRQRGVARNGSRALSHEPIAAASEARVLGPYAVPKAAVLRRYKARVRTLASESRADGTDGRGRATHARLVLAVARLLGLRGGWTNGKRRPKTMVHTALRDAVGWRFRACAVRR